ncbi:unnamed protein product [Calicophoron daubneyi]|uniref:Uncharacterized protein n=1 Tax=Calicophoron daubneyi TaxID=300641 RepID=A0AAV2U0F3_CALDB
MGLTEADPQVDAVWHFMGRPGVLSFSGPEEKLSTGLSPSNEETIKVIYGIKPVVRTGPCVKRSLGIRGRLRDQLNSKFNDGKKDKSKKQRAISLVLSGSESESSSSGEEWTPRARQLSKVDMNTLNSCFQQPVDKTLQGGGKKVMELSNSEEGRRYPFREKKRPNYSLDITIPEDDRSLYCYECNESLSDGCTKHPVVWVENNPLVVCEQVKDKFAYCQTSRCVCRMPYYLHSAQTAPREWVSVSKSGIGGAGLGVWANRAIKCGTTFGPYTGDVVNLDEMGDDEFTKRSRGGYAWLVRKNFDGVKDHLVDARNPLCSNWLRFVNCARCEEEQNLVTIQYRGRIYYRACRDISEHQELLTYYGAEFAAELARCEHTLLQSSGHYSERSAACDLCGKTFSDNGYLKRHIRTVHNGSASPCISGNLRRTIFTQ